MIQTGLSYAFPIPTHVYFGAGQLNNLHTLPMPGKNALLVISNGKSTRANGYLDRTIGELRQAGADYVLFDRIQANPIKPTIEVMGGLVQQDRQPLAHDEIVEILKKSYK